MSFSPGAHFIFNVVENTLIVRRTDTLQITRTWTVTAPSTTSTILSKSSSSGATPDGWISHAGWSCDSEYLLAASAKKGIIEAFKLRDETWNARIEAGAEGLLKAEWAPDGRHILCFSQWGVSRHYILMLLSCLRSSASSYSLVSNHRQCHLHTVSNTP